MDPELSGDHKSYDPNCDKAKIICNNLNKEGFYVAQEAGCDFQEEGKWPLEFPTGLDGSVEKECSVAFQNAPLPRYNAHSDEGCWVFAGDFDFIADNDCAYAKARAGIVINGNEFLDLEGSDFLEIRSFESGDSYDDWKFNGKYPSNEADDSYCMIASLKWRWNLQESYMCADDHYWHKCMGGEDDLGTLTWANDNIYNCTRDKDTNLPVWKLMGEDKDQDGYTTENDCADDPKDPILQQTDCPELDIETGSIDCEYPRDSKCAICINPGAPEVCGDELNNDCRSFGNSFSADSLENPEGETSDNCNKNQYACEQRGEPLLGKKGSEGDVCSDKQYKTQEKCEENNETWSGTGDSTGPLQYNVLAEDFSWVNTPDGGYCCGYNGTDDLGETATNSEGNYVCLNNADELVGTNENIEDLNWGTEQTPCSNWCWVKASAGNILFKVLTIKKPGKPVFDIVSNSEKWYKCNEGVTDLALPGSEGDDEVSFLEVANRFHCYKEGNHWSWAECHGANDFTKNENTIKGRLAGEGLYSLYLVDKTENSEGEIFGDRIELDNNEGAYENFYGDTDLDFTGYDYLEFMIKFVADEQGTSIEKLDDLVLPLNVSLEIRGRPEKVDEKGPLLFQGNALGYVINNPSFTGDDWMHVRIPIDNTLQGIQKIVIQSQPEENNIGIKNVRLTKENEKNILCSGQDSRDYTSWLTDLDDGETAITGENLCTALYGEEAWFGNDDEVKDDSANCCGNSENEYYAGKSKDVVIIEANTSSEPKKYGCWNSQTVASGNTIMDVKFNVEYKETKQVVEFLPITIKKPISTNYFVGSDTKQLNCNIPGEMQPGENLKQLCDKFKLNDLNDAVYGSTSLKVTYSSSDKYDVIFFDLTTFEEVGYPVGENEDPNSLSPYHFIENETAKELWYHDLTIFARLKDGAFFELKQNPPQKLEVPGNKQVTYSCTEDECLYPLPGEPPYTITNPFPHVYELYFVTGPQKEDEVLIEGTYNTNEYGNLKAR
ncbi:MAG: hypothetical protein KKA62_01570, partial [Nanoarchaeota archaeon]|nr:hypothetical protein [Nanoarchaeota archaeon]MBU1976621.1 hypothetical protein [Nanoarchaeota archaeon]